MFNILVMQITNITNNKTKDNKMMKKQFEFLLDEIKAQEKRILKAEQTIGLRENRIKLLEDLCETEDKIINEKDEKIKGLESLLSKYGTVHRDSFTPHNYILNVLKYKDELIKQGHFCAKGKTYDVIQTTRHDELK